MCSYLQLPHLLLQQLLSQEFLEQLRQLFLLLLQLFKKLLQTCLQQLFIQQKLQEIWQQHLLQ